MFKLCLAIVGFHCCYKDLVSYYGASVWNPDAFGHKVSSSQQVAGRLTVTTTPTAP